jgi:hypothetical protein
MQKNMPEMTKLGALETTLTTLIQIKITHTGTCEVGSYRPECFYCLQTDRVKVHRTPLSEWRTYDPAMVKEHM